LTQLRLPAGSGKRRTESDSGGLNERHYFSHMALPRPLIQRTRTSAPLRPRKKKPAYRIFPASRAEATGCSRIITMWRPNESVEEGDSDLPGNHLQNKRRRSRRGAWRDGLADQTVIPALEDVWSYRAFERTLIGSIDPRSVIELALVHRLASLLWRLHRASAIETGLFEIQAEFLLARRQTPALRPGQPVTLQTPAQANGHKIASGPNGRDQATPSTSLHPSLAPGSNSRLAAQCFLRLSNLDPTLLDRVGSYETRLWRQAAQTIWTLEEIRRPPPAPTRRRFRKPAGISYWDVER
jgi:hypothetical protein